MATKLKVKVNGRWYTVEVGDLDEFPIQTVVDDELVEVEVDDLPSTGSPLVAVADVPTPRQTTSEPVNRPTPTAGAVKAFKSPMPGVIVSVAVKVGDQVVTGDPICILEAMKMQQTLRADWSGIVQAVHVSAGEQVIDGQAIADLE